MDRTDPRHSLITVLPDDQKGLHLQELLLAAQSKRASVVWKQALWGTGRDVAFLHRLLRLPPLGDIAGDPDDEAKRWVIGQGFKPFHGNGKPIPRWWNDEQLYLNARCKEINLAVVPEDASPVGSDPKLLHRSRRCQLLATGPTHQKRGGLTA